MGLYESFGNIPQHLQSILNGDCQCLSGIKCFNQHYECRKTAVLINKEGIEFLVIEQIFKIQSDHILSGSKYIGVSENCSRINLISSDVKDFVLLSNLKFKHSYQIYVDESFTFVVPYFYLELV